MTPEQFAKLLLWIDNKIGECRQLAGMYAIEFVQSEDPKTRELALGRMHDAEQWEVMKRLHCQARGS